MPSASIRHLIASREAHSAELERLLARSDGNGLRTFEPEDIAAVGRSYRAVVSDLSIAQRDFPYDELTIWLNGLATRAHLRLYRSAPPSWR
jgi:hypothetical protein